MRVAVNQKNKKLLKEREIIQHTLWQLAQKFSQSQSI